MRRLTGTVVLILALTVGVTALADADSCREAIALFKSAKANVPNYVRTFAACVSRSDGHDDCAREFTALQSVQADFESAISQHESECQ